MHFTLIWAQTSPQEVPDKMPHTATPNKCRQEYQLEVNSHCTQLGYLKVKG